MFVWRIWINGEKYWRMELKGWPPLHYAIAPVRLSYSFSIAQIFPLFITIFQKDLSKNEVSKNINMANWKQNT